MMLNHNQISVKYQRHLAKIQNRHTWLKKRISKTIVYTLLIAWLLISLFPFAWAIIASFNKYSEVSSLGLNPTPSEATTENYEFLFQNDITATNIRIWFRNSFIYAGLSAFLNVFFNMLAGYALARIAFRAKKAVFWYLIVGTMIPAQVTQIPQLILLINMGAIGTHASDARFFAGILFTGMTSATWIFMARQFYINHSKTVEEAARVDGLGTFAMFIRISLRQMIPIMATMFTMVFMASWNNFIMFVLWAAGDMTRMTLVSGLQVVGDSAFAVAPQFARIVTLAATNIVVIPVILIYFVSLWFQKKAGIHGEK